MLVFASSDKGGTGRSVTSCNLAYWLSLMGKDVAYLDFDFGSPTAGAIFETTSVERGSDHGGLHSYIAGKSSSLHRVDVRKESVRVPMKTRPPGSGRLVLVPGDRGGAEFGMKKEHVDRAADLLRKLDREFDVCVIDLSAGRSQAVEMSLRALATPMLHPTKSKTTVRWLVFHRWTRQHVLAAAGLIYEGRGLEHIANDAGHDDGFLDLVRTVRTAVPDLNSEHAAQRPVQAQWLRTSDGELRDLAKRHRLGQGIMLGATPMEPMLQWREQIILDSDVVQGFANPETVAAFRELAEKLNDDQAYVGV
jgi:hypothetical protein